MSNLKSLIGSRKPTREDWILLADSWGVGSDYELSEIAPADVTCKLCWDLDICAECLGESPHECPMECGDGSCYDHRTASKYNGPFWGDIMRERGEY